MINHCVLIDIYLSRCILKKEASIILRERDNGYSKCKGSSVNLRNTFTLYLFYMENHETLTQSFICDTLKIIAGVS